MGEIINPALAGIHKQQGSKLPELRAKADAWSARNDLRAYQGSLRDLAGLCPAFDRRSLADGDVIRIGTLEFRLDAREPEPSGGEAEAEPPKKRGLFGGVFQLVSSNSS